MNKFDYLIVGSGMFGAVFARIMAENGKKCFVIDKRNHIGGNCYTESVEGINVHKYGAHIFHTNNYKIWKFINKFSNFINYTHKVKVNFKNKIYSFPINLMTLHQIWGINTPNEAVEKLNQLKIKIKNPKNFEEWALSQIGNELYEMFIKGYTVKQWSKDPIDLPISIIKRLPIRLTYNDQYFTDCYQGVPKNGYTTIFENMLDHKNITNNKNINFYENKNYFLNLSKKIIFTGKIDEFYDYKFGKLEYRSLKFEEKILDGDFQGNSVINYTSSDVKYTRIIEHKHFENKNSKKTVVTYEYPDDCDNECKVPYYPINDEKNNRIYKMYREIPTEKILFEGRLGRYQYFDMHQVVASAIKCAKKEIKLYK
jgi:UDP-galactopyranose mutase